MWENQKDPSLLSNQINRYVKKTKTKEYKLLVNMWNFCFSLPGRKSDRKHEWWVWSKGCGRWGNGSNPMPEGKARSWACTRFRFRFVDPPSVSSRHSHCRGLGLCVRSLLSTSDSSKQTSLLTYAHASTKFLCFNKNKRKMLHFSKFCS